MANNSYFPTPKMVQSLFTSHGFHEYKSVAELRIGGYVFFRNHSDGRLQAAYVFPWSNFKLAEETGSSPCLLHVRLKLDVHGSEDEAWGSTPYGSGLAIPFEKGGWKLVQQHIKDQIAPIFDAPLNEGQELLAARPWSY